MVRVLLLRSRWCSPGPDRAAHGNLDFTDWYLKQIADYYVANGVKLLDYLDVHYYPQASGISLSDDESAAASARRLRTVKSLYDPTYADESWIDTMGMGPVRLIPRLRGWIDGRFTGAAAAARPKIAISEYNWATTRGRARRSPRRRCWPSSGAKASTSQRAGWLPRTPARSRTRSSCA
jgi:hypothetical protein